MMRLKRPQFAEDMPFQPNLILAGKGYQYPYDLFPDKKPVQWNGSSISSALDQATISDCEEWAYIKRIVPKGSYLDTYYGTRRGWVVFDDDIAVPQIWAKTNSMFSDWTLWMSYTPAEVFSMRGGIRKAKQHTVIAGLGLGYQLIKVANKPTVKKITLIEQSEGLWNFLGERIKRFLPDNLLLELRFGDAYRIFENINADTALIDIFDGYGGNDISYFREKNPKIKTFWGWGTSDLYR